MRAWLEAAVSSAVLTEAQLEHVVGRGVTFSRAADLGVVGWTQPPTDAPDPLFRKRNGPRGHRVEGHLTFPLFSPRGQLLGVEFRCWDGPKRVSQYLLPEADWCPVLVGLTPGVMQRIWDGCDVWLVEGVFDLGAMEQVVPQGDVVLGTLRARVSEQHVAFLRRFCRGLVHVVYDNDETGQRETFGYVDKESGKRRWGALEKLDRVGVGCRAESYRGGKDPGQIWEQSGTDGLRRAFGALLTQRLR